MERPEQILRDVLIRRMQKNPRYSSRALARDLGISPTYLSLIMSGKRKLSLRAAQRFGSALGLEEKDRESFLTSVAWSAVANGKAGVLLGKLLKPAPRASGAEASVEYFAAEADQLRCLTEWYYPAILDLATCENFKPDVRWVAKRLRIPVHAVEDAIDRLVRLKLLEVTSKGWRKIHRRIAFRPEKSEASVRQHHRQMIEKAIEALSSGAPKDFERRSITGTTFAVDASRLDEAMKLIDDFREQLAELLTEGNCTEVYRLNVQLFPLSYPVGTKERERNETS
jgi:uncharacterized protein (TIGR02147 family)